MRMQLNNQVAFSAAGGRARLRTRSLFVIALTGVLTAACASGPVVTSRSLDGLSANVRVAGYYALPKAYYRLTLTRGKADKPPIAFGDAQYYPDTSRLYAISYQNNDLSSDKIAVETDGLGLLKSVAPTSEDATGEIVKKVIELAKDVTKMEWMTITEQASTKTIDCTHAPAVDREYFIDPAAWTPNNRERVRNETCFDIDIKLAVPAPKAPSFHPCTEVEAKADAEKNQCSEGIYYRPALPYNVTIIDLKQLNGQPTPQNGAVRTYIAMAPSPELTLVAPLNRHAFTGLHTSLTFSNGMLTKFESTDPNQAAAALQIPIDALTAIAAIPGELLAVKVKNVNDEKGYLDAQRNLIEAQTQLAAALKAQAEAAGKK